MTKTIAEIIASGTWDEEQHPRDEHGRFGQGDGGGESDTRREARQAMTEMLDDAEQHPHHHPSGKFLKAEPGVGGGSV